MHFNDFFSFFFFYIIHTNYVVLGVIYALFLAQNFKLEFDRAKKSTFRMSGLGVLLI